MKFNQLKTPCYVIDEKKLKQNLTILNNLENKQFISIKYIDNINVCLCITELGKQILNNASDKIQKNKKIKIEIIILSILIFIFSFLGAFLGTIICNLFL